MCVCACSALRVAVQYSGILFTFVRIICSRDHIRLWLLHEMAHENAATHFIGNELCVTFIWSDLRAYFNCQFKAVGKFWNNISIFVLSLSHWEMLSWMDRFRGGFASTWDHLKMIIRLYQHVCPSIVFFPLFELIRFTYIYPHIFSNFNIATNWMTKNADTYILSMTMTLYVFRLYDRIVFGFPIVQFWCACNIHSHYTITRITII